MSLLHETSINVFNQLQECALWCKMYGSTQVSPVSLRPLLARLSTDCSQLPPTDRMWDASHWFLEDMADHDLIHQPGRQHLRAAWQDTVFWTRRNRVFATYCGIVTFFTTWYCLLTITSRIDNYSHLLARNGSEVLLPKSTVGGTPRIAKVTLASGIEDLAYERALDTHRDHARIHGYPMYIGRESAWPGAYNKIAYLMSILLNELFKPPEDRVEWLWYVSPIAMVKPPRRVLRADCALVGPMLTVSS